jgi:ABC-2 type transport system ATP-binding protein
MESVEEICDHIALINNSKTILEGTIDKIKNEFQANTYEIVLNTNQLLACKEFEICSSKDNIYNLKINDGFKIKQIIKEINDKHEIISFKKEIPSVEDIFIKSVNNE